LVGHTVTLAGLDPDAHGDALWRAIGGADHAPLWDWLPEGPFLSRDTFIASLRDKARSSERVYFTIVSHHPNAAAGYLALMRIEPAHRVIEVGSVVYSPALQRTRGGTEAMYLVARHVFEDLGYRRFEWKCHAQNEASRRAAVRYGFTFEGIFRQHMIVKGRSRDTAWYAMLDVEWPSRKAAFEAWLVDANFDAAGRQRTRLGRE
jgi:RimJ/RimL family protein N-acetyltransferase